MWRNRSNIEIIKLLVNYIKNQLLKKQIYISWNRKNNPSHLLPRSTKKHFNFMRYINAGNISGNSALHLASHFGYSKYVSYLLKNGARNLKNKPHKVSPIKESDSIDKRLEDTFSEDFLNKTPYEVAKIQMLKRHSRITEPKKQSMIRAEKNFLSKQENVWV